MGNIILGIMFYFVIVVFMMFVGFKISVILRKKFKRN